MFEFDKSGFFIILVDHNKKKIIVEHYNYVKEKNLIKTGKINQVLEGTKAEDLYKENNKKRIAIEVGSCVLLGDGTSKS